jgi:anaphase-promoting complex subunit 6
LAAARPLQDHDDFGWHVLADTVGTRKDEPIHFLARLCCWRGRAYHETGHGARAALFWKRALQIDVQCQAAWDYLLERHLIPPQEAYQFLQQLPFPADLEWLKALYLARIELPPQETYSDTSSNNSDTSNNSFSFAMQQGTQLDASVIPFSSPIPTFHTPAGAGLKPEKESSLLSPMQKDVDAAFDKLWNEHKLQNSPHVLAMAARRAYRRYQWKSCLYYCESLAQLDPNVTGAAYCYLATLVLLGHKQALFRLAHEWVEAAPKSAQAWFAVGAYYFGCGRFHVAQRHFCRATRLDPQCTEAWIAFGCAFAACDESDQALASFRAAQRLSPGEHTSLLYMGMEYVRTNHLVLAQYFLNSALASSGGDPLCLHELGVLHAQKGESDKAIVWLERALVVVVGGGGEVDLVSDPYWEPTLFGLGHCYRRTRQFDKAAACFQQCVALCPEKASTYAALAFTKHLVHDLDGAIDYYHQALSLKSDDPFCTEMLQRALHEQAMSSSTTTTNSKVSFVVDPPGWKEGESMMSSMDVDMSDSRATP